MFVANPYIVHVRQQLHIVLASISGIVNTLGPMAWWSCAQLPPPSWTRQAPGFIKRETNTPRRGRDRVVDDGSAAANRYTCTLSALLTPPEEKHACKAAALFEAHESKRARIT